MRCASCFLFALLVAGAAPAAALEVAGKSKSAANPIRKVVTLLQNMVRQVTAEGKREEDLYHKFMCYCQTGTGDLEKSIDAANVKIPELQSDIEASEGKKAQLEKDVEAHQSDRAAANKAMADATEVRKKEKAAYDKESADLTANIAAAGNAVTALEKGMGGSFLQSSTAQVLRRMLQSRADSLDADKQEVLAFLSGSDSYAPQSGEIVGILKTMHDEMSADLKAANEAEAKAIADFKGLMAAKKKEVAALDAMIEEKLVRIADLGVRIQEMKNDLTDTEEALVEDTKFLEELKRSCATKTSEYEANQKVRAEELVALADTIKILNDDDALDLFKKTLPSASASASFVQIQVSEASMRSRALSMINNLRAHAKRPQLDFIAMALHGKKIGFEKVIKMIDDLVAELEQEQLDDDKKKEYCSEQFDRLDDSKKALERKISDLTTAIEEAKEGIETLQSEIKALKESIAALDKSVAEATAQRKEEHEDFKELMANDAAAKEILAFAKNRLNKFYNPKLYKAPAKEELSKMDRISTNMAFVQLSAKKDAPPPPPETAGPYIKKSQESNGAIAMIDLLVKDLDKEMTEAETTEKDSQADYEKLMADAAEKRTEDTKNLSDKESALADLQAALESHTDERASTSKELAATMQEIQALHNECDWLLKYFDVRKDARASEIDALGKAKAVLSGADYSFVQTRRLLQRK